MEKYKIINHNNLNIILINTKNGYFLNNISIDNNPQDDVAYLPFTYSVSGDNHGLTYSMCDVYSNINSCIICEACDYNKNSVNLTYFDSKNSLKFYVEMKLIKDANAICQKVTVKNTGTKAVVLTGLSGAMLRSFNRNDGLSLDYCQNTWQGEGQYYTKTFDELNIKKFSKHPSTSSFSLVSKTSQTTSTYFPLAIVSSLDKSEVSFMEVMPNGAWNIEVGVKSDWDNTYDFAYLIGGSAEEKSLNFHHVLAPEEKYFSAEIIIGKAKGGFNGAINELYIARRTLRSKILYKPYVFFNDYMNCLWANTNEHNVYSLIDAACDIGADAYIIDAGWFGDYETAWNNLLGDWNTQVNRFGKCGLQGVINYIKSKGLKAGIWFEIEVATVSADVFQKDDWFIKLYNQKYFGDGRSFFDFTNKEVCKYLSDKMQRLIDMGITFIKNDYNDSYIGVSDDLSSEIVFRLEKNTRAFYEFIDQIMCKNPDLIIENCASGSMRSDGNTLNHFNFQSVSDQEDYKKYPSIIKGQLANILNNQLGIWIMPYGVSYNESKNLNLIKSKEFAEQFEDGEITVFNMVNGLLGVPYISGRIDLLDAFNVKLLKEGIELYKNLFDFYKTAKPYYIFPHTHVNNNEYDMVVLKNYNKKLLFVWRLGGENNVIDIPMKIQSARLIYPAENHIEYNVENDVLKIKFNKTYMARIFEIQAEIQGVV